MTTRDSFESSRDVVVQIRQRSSVSGSDHEDETPADMLPSASRLCLCCCFFAALGGGLHGFHNAVMGGIITRPDFIEEFYPELLRQPVPTSIYCQYSSQRLSLVTSSLFAASVIAESTGLPAYLSRRHGRPRLMFVSGLLFTLASIIQTSAVNIAMLVVSRCLAGVGLSCATVSVLLYISEISPAKSRGKYNQLFQLQLTGFILLANIINFADQSFKHGWRLAAGLGVIPAVMFMIVGLMLPDSPSSLMERGKLAHGRRALVKFRTASNSEAIVKESAEIFSSTERARRCRNPWHVILRRPHRPQLVLVILSTLFQQFTGINFVIFYGPQLFLQLGNSVNTSQWIVLVVSLVNHLSAYVSFFKADTWGRRPLLICCGVFMLVGLLGIGVSLNVFGDRSWLPWIVLVFVCVFDVSYGMSWGPLGWLYPTEIQDLATRACGITIASIVNVFFSFVLAQTALNFLCALKSGVFYFFAGCVVVMTTSVFYLFPETRNVPVEQSFKLFRDHPVWKRYVTSS